MQVIHEPADLDRLSDVRRDGPLVLVPTMGALHEGHLELVRHGRDLGPVVVTIFVNPTQFGRGEDFAAYPRTLDDDLAKLDPLGVQVVFAPSTETMYGPSADSGAGVTVQPGRRAEGLCGARRPGHFAGVLTIVAKLFNLIAPQVAVFGRKDAQQCLVIDEMVSDLKMPIRLLDVPTIREPDGLAMSSRNRYLEGDQRQRALGLYHALERARSLLEEGCRDASVLSDAMRQEMAATDGVEYAEIRRVPDLDPCSDVAGRTLLAVAARVGPARLIDNLVLEIDSDGVRDSHLLGTGGES